MGSPRKLVMDCSICDAPDGEYVCRVDTERYAMDVAMCPRCKVKRLNKAAYEWAESTWPTNEPTLEERIAKLEADVARLKTHHGKQFLRTETETPAMCPHSDCHIGREVGNHPPHHPSLTVDQYLTNREKAWGNDRTE